MFKKSKQDGALQIVRKGYDTKQVDDYIKKQRENFELVISELRERLNLYKEETLANKRQIEMYAAREDEIKTSLYLAADKANEMTFELKMQYAMEIERLKIFQAKWTNAYEELKERYHFDKDALNMEAAVVSTRAELEKFLCEDLSLNREETGGEAERQFKAEVSRMGADETEMMGLAEKLKAEIKKAEIKKNKDSAGMPNIKLAETAFSIDKNTPFSKENTDKFFGEGMAGFSIEEAKKPSVPLEDILKSLGIDGKRNN